MADVTMPQLGETVTEGTITKWFKQVGDKVEADEVLFEVSTDKVDSEVPSPAAGYLAEIVVQEGETVDVGAKLAVISDDAPSGDGQAAAPAKEDEAEPEDEAEEAPEPEPEPEAEAEAEEAPEAEPEAAEDGDGDAAADAAEEEQAGTPEPAQRGAKQPRGRRPADGRPARGPDGGSKLLSPVVRRLIAEHDLDPDQIEGTGAGGRITRNDVLKIVESGRRGDGEAKPAAKERTPAPSRREERRPAPEKRERPAAPAAKAGERDETIPFSNIRRRTAEHMLGSKATAAHTLVSIEVDYSAVDRVRLAEKDRFRAEEGISLTYLPFIARAVVDAIRDYPKVNASVGDDALIVHHDIHLGIAVDLNLEGLLVPVVKSAAEKRLVGLAREMADLAARARSKKLSADEIAGGTFTITNPGPFGTLITYPIINQPQVAILSTDGVKKRPVVVEMPDGTDGIAIHPVGNLALAFDHRAIDGAYASVFIARVKELLETRDWEQEL